MNNIMPIIIISIPPQELLSEDVLEEGSFTSGVGFGGLGSILGELFVVFCFSFFA